MYLFRNYEKFGRIGFRVRNVKVGESYPERESKGEKTAWAI